MRDNETSVGYNFTLASIDDGEQLASLHKKCFQKPWNAKEFEKLLENEYVIGLKAKRNSDKQPPLSEGEADASDHPFVGFILVQYVIDTADILTICISKSDRNLNVGTELLGEMLTLLREKDVARVLLEVASDNFSAIRLYEKHSFKVISRREDYYHHDDKLTDALVYCLELTEKDTTTLNS